MPQISKEEREYREKLVRAVLDASGREINNPVPFFIDVTPTPPTMIDQLKKLMKGELSKRAAEQGFETFEEANDFEVDEDPDPIEPYPVVDMVPEEAKEFRDPDSEPLEETEKPENAEVKK